ncbi:MAG: LacI family DNA-binding transcriptional regulator [Planctomycetota bacterium]
METTVRVSLKDVAERAGVTKSTVSRILNGHRNNFSVREETRDRVMLAAEELGYRPNPILRSLSAKQTKLIAVLGLTDFGTAIRGGTEEAANALMRRLYADGYELCRNVLSPHEPEYALPRWRVDGAVVVDNDCAEQVEALDRSGLPYVTINGPAGGRGSSVTVDDAAAIRLAVHHLRALGHRRIAYVAPDEFNWHQSLIDRREAYVAALGEVGLEPVAGHDALCVNAFDAIRRSVVEGGATAVIAYHHLMAIKLLRAAALVGLAVPRDLSLMCFNDVPPCADLVPSLTAVALPSEQMGRHAAEILLSTMTADDPRLEHRKLAGRLVIRESTAPPRENEP